MGFERTLLAPSISYITAAYNVILLWSPYGIGQTFHPVVCSSSFFFFSSPNLSHRRVDVCHTSTHGVALVRI